MQVFCRTERIQISEWCTARKNSIEILFYSILWPIQLPLFSLPFINRFLCKCKRNENKQRCINCIKSRLSEPFWVCYHVGNAIYFSHTRGLSVLWMSAKITIDRMHNTLLILFSFAEMGIDASSSLLNTYDMNMQIELGKNKK